MNTTSKIIIFIFIMIALYWCYNTFGGSFTDKFNNIKNVIETEIDKDVEVPTDDETDKDKEQEAEEVTVNVYFIKIDNNGNQFLKGVARKISPDENKLKFAINELLKGPNSEEKKQGLYNEIPDGVRFLGFSTQNGATIIDLSSEFANGGGSDSIYSRMRQLIKTILTNTDTPVYLYINGVKADVIGGEGISITQPLSENSLDG